MNFGNVQGLKLSINCFADVKLEIADVKLKMTNSRRQFFAAVKNSEFQGLHTCCNLPVSECVEVTMLQGMSLFSCLFVSMLKG